MKQLSTSLKNELVKILDNTAEFETKFTVNKYDLFVEARTTTNEFIRYRDVKHELEQFLIDYCNEHSYNITINFSGDFKKYIIETTEESSSDVVLTDLKSPDTKNRIRIPVKYMRLAGFDDKIVVHCITVKDDEENIKTFIDYSSNESYDNYEIISEKWIRVEYDGSIRFVTHVKEDGTNPITAMIRPGKIEVY